MIPSILITCKNCVLFFCFADEGRGSDRGVLVHCLAGISRSVTVTVAYLMYERHLSLNDAYDFVKRCKPNVSPNFNFMGKLLDFEETLKSGKFTKSTAPPPKPSISFRQMTAAVIWSATRANLAKTCSVTAALTRRAYPEISSPRRLAAFLPCRLLPL